MTDLRVAYLREDLGKIADDDLRVIKHSLPDYRGKGCAKKLMTMMLEEAKACDICAIELKSTEDGYGLYKAVGFEDVKAKHHNMKIVLK